MAGAISTTTARGVSDSRVLSHVMEYMAATTSYFKGKQAARSSLSTSMIFLTQASQIDFYAHWTVLHATMQTLLPMCMKIIL